MEDGLLNELSRFTLSVEHFLLDRIESDFFRCLCFQTFHRCRHFLHLSQCRLAPHRLHLGLSLIFFSIHFGSPYFGPGVPRNPFRSISVANEMEYGELSV